jgi:hypothetical protein
MQTAKISAFVLALALVTSACGDSMSSLNPTAPSALSPDSVNVEAGAAAGAMGNGPKPGNGNGNGNNGGGNGNGNGKQPALTSTTPDAGRVRIEGPIEAAGTASLTVNGQLVSVTAETVLRHGNLRLTLADLHVGDRVHVVAKRVAAGSSLSTLEATEVKLQNPGDGAGEGEEPPPPPTGLVSVLATDATAVEGAAGDTAVFRLTRAGDATLLAAPLTVSFTLTGAAVNGTDYAMVQTSVVFAANAATADVVISPVADGADEGAESVLLTLTAAAPYELGSPVTASASIEDPPVPTVSVVARESTISTSDPLGFALGVFDFTRTGNLSAPMTVNFSVTGSAAGAYGADLIAMGVTFRANESTATASFIVMQGSATGTVVLTVLDVAAYNPGTPAAATITVTP